MTLCRYDLKQTGLSDAEIAVLSDEDMEVIAQEMDNFIEDYYFDKEVWEHVTQIGLHRLELARTRKEKQP